MRFVLTALAMIGGIVFTLIGLGFFFVPDTEGNHRMGATVGMTW